MPTLPTTFKSKLAHRMLMARKRRENQRRTLPTNSTRWRRLREQHLAREPLCRECARHGRTTAGTDVDHIDGNSSNNKENNLQTLCRSCHGTKTAREVGFMKSG